MADLVNFWLVQVFLSVNLPNLLKKRLMPSVQNVMEILLSSEQKGRSRFMVVQITPSVIMLPGTAPNDTQIAT